MKHTLYLLLTCMATLYGVSSCKKDDIPVTNNTGSQVRPVYVAEFQADNWIQDSNGFYVHTFHNVIYQGSSVKVFLVSGGREEQIHQYMPLMGGQLWANTHDADLTLFFRCSGPLPFSSLSIKIEVN